MRTCTCPAIKSTLALTSSSTCAIVWSKTIASLRGGAVAGAVAAGGAAAAAGPDDSEDAKPKCIEPAERGGVPQCLAGGPCGGGGGGPAEYEYVVRSLSGCCSCGRCRICHGSKSPAGGGASPHCGGGCMICHGSNSPVRGRAGGGIPQKPEGNAICSTCFARLSNICVCLHAWQAGPWQA